MTDFLLSCSIGYGPILQVFWYRTRLTSGPAKEIQLDLTTASILKMWLSTALVAMP